MNHTEKYVTKQGICKLSFRKSRAICKQKRISLFMNQKIVPFVFKIIRKSCIACRIIQITSTYGEKMEIRPTYTGTKYMLHNGVGSLPVYGRAVLFTYVEQPSYRTKHYIAISFACHTHVVTKYQS